MRLLVLSVIFCGCFLSCKKEADPEVPLSVRVRHEVDGDPVLPDTLLYVSDAGYAFQVGRVRYFLYDFSLITTENLLEPVGGFQLVDSRNSVAQGFQAGEAPRGDYIGIEFYLGLSQGSDRPSGLSSTPEYDDMTGAPPSLGTYHYMKFEGRYLQNDTLQNFMLNLAGTDSRIRYRLLKNFTVEAGGHRLDLVMNLGEWLRNPQDYDFVIDGPNSLDSPSTLSKLVSNGSDVFMVE